MIKKHELTRKKKEEDRTKLTNIQSANVGPVFLTYQDSEEINVLVKKIISTEPYFDVKTDDGVQHTVKKLIKTTKKLSYFSYGNALKWNQKSSQLCSNWCPAYTLLMAIIVLLLLIMLAKLESKWLWMFFHYYLLNEIIFFLLKIGWSKNHWR